MSNDVKPFAYDEDNECVYWSPAACKHTVISGVTGSGKSVATQGILYGALVPDVQFVGIDPSASLLRPFHVFAGRPSDFVLGDHDSWVDDATDLLRAAYAVMRQRIAELGWSEKIHDFTPETPVVVVILEEYANFLAECDRVDKKRRGEIESLVSSILREGRKVGVICFTILQRAEAKTLNDRSQYGCRISFRQDNNDSVKMLFDDPDPADVARIRQLPPGQGVIQVDGRAMRWIITPDVDYEMFVPAVRVNVFTGHAPIRKETSGEQE